MNVQYELQKECDGMKNFEIKTDDAKIQSINRTIRMKPEYFDRISQLSEETGVSFNKIINQCIEYALENMSDKDEQ